MLPAGSSNAARVGILGMLEFDQRDTYTRSLLQRQPAVGGKSERQEASIASAGNVKPRGSQQGSIPARTSRVAETNTPARINTRADTSRDNKSVGSVVASRQGSSNAAANQITASKQTVTSSSTRRRSGSLDFGEIPTLDLSSGLDSMQSGLSDLVDEFKSQGGFWKEGSLQDNISNMVQLGVKGTLGLVSPIGEDGAEQNNFCKILCLSTMSLGRTAAHIALRTAAMH